MFSMKRSSLGKYWPTLYEVTRACASAMNVPAVLNLIVRDVAEAMNVKASSIHLLDPGEKSLELAAAYGLSDEFLRRSSIALEKSLIDKEALQGKPIAIPDFSSDPRVQYREEAKREGIASVLCVPLPFKDKMIGTIRVYTSAPHEFTDEELSLLMMFAAHAAIVIQNTRLYQMVLRNWQKLVDEVLEKWPISTG